MCHEKRITMIAAAAMAAMVTIGWPYAVNAQSSESGANSSSSSSTDVESAASANASGGNSNAQIYLDQRGPSSLSTQHSYSGKYTVRSAPSVQPPSMGSGHPCALGGSIGISLIGGGAAAGLNRVDDACLLAQMGQGQAALIMIARRDEEACKALAPGRNDPGDQPMFPLGARAADQFVGGSQPGGADACTCRGTDRVHRALRQLFAARGRSHRRPQAFGGAIQRRAGRRILPDAAGTLTGKLLP